MQYGKELSVTTGHVSVAILCSSVPVDPQGLEPQEWPQVRLAKNWAAQLNPTFWTRKLWANKIAAILIY